MREYTNTNPVFSDSVQIVETTDPAHADNINASTKQLLQNTLVNKQGLEMLCNVDNTPDKDKPVSDATADAIQAAYENATKYADRIKSDIYGGVPAETLDTIKEIADALTNEQNVIAEILNELGKKAKQAELETHVGNNAIHITTTERVNWNAAKTHADSKHAPSDAASRACASTTPNLYPLHLIGAISKNDAVQTYSCENCYIGSDGEIYSGGEKVAHRNDLLNLIYPVGSIYLSVKNTSPATFLGGTWEQIEDVFLLGAGYHYEAGSTGGSATEYLEEANIPSHMHSIPALSGTAASAGAHTHTVTGGNAGKFGGTGTGYVYNVNAGTTALTSTASAGAHTHTVTTTASSTGKTGTGAGHNNMPPYLTVYMWKRTK